MVAFLKEKPGQDGTASPAAPKARETGAASGTPETLVLPGLRSGCVQVPSSKSELHRLLLLAASGVHPVTIEYRGLSRDIEATAACLRGLGASVDQPADGFLRVLPLAKILPQHEPLPCAESGSTLRFLLPFAGSRGIACAFRMEGRLPERPLAPFDEELGKHGMTLRREGNTLFCSGQLEAGEYRLPGNISSQYISALLLALPLLGEESVLKVIGPVESAAYIGITLSLLARAGVRVDREGQIYRIPGGQRPNLPEQLQAEGDWSSAAFFLCMGALSEEGICVNGLHPDSPQGDRQVLDILLRMGAVISPEAAGIRVKRGTLRGIEVDASGVPDLVPALAALAAAAEGRTRITGAARLRLKESDRLRTTTEMLSALGADIEETGDGLVINGKERLRGGRCRTAADHRIAMAAAVAACAASEPVLIGDSGCVAKSYPQFFKDLESLEVKDV